MLLHFLLFYLLFGVYAAIVGYCFDPPPVTTKAWEHVIMFLVLVVIWPLTYFGLALDYSQHHERRR